MESFANTLERVIHQVYEGVYDNPIVNGTNFLLLTSEELYVTPYNLR
jgi:hypothetical protein